MSSGKTHEKINVTLLGVILVFLTFVTLGNFGYVVMFVVGYVFGTFWFGPDLDIKSRPYNRWKSLRHFWKPYQKLGHRSVFTHGILIGDIIRFIYLALPLIVISLIVSELIGIFDYSTIDVVKSIAKNTYFLWFFTGNVVASAAHTITDVISSGFNRFKRRFKK